MCPDRHLKTPDEVDIHLRSLITWHATPGKLLAQLCRSVHGAYPTDVLAQATVLRERGEIQADAAVFSHTPSPQTIALEVAQSKLPLPHPNDFEWRFSHRGCEVITDIVRSLVRTEGSQVALLGTSGYAEYVSGADIPILARLFELRPEACSVIESLRSMAVTIGDVGQTWHHYPTAFDCVVADPPWYPKVIETFIRAAAGLLEDGGTLLLCAPGLTTRPGLPAERRNLLATAASEGLILDQLLPRAVEYESPPFELSALQAGGLAGFDPYWRVGDLFTFRRLPGARGAKSFEPGEQLSIDNGWAEVTLGRARIRVNTNRTQPATTDQPLEGVVPGNVLDSVSSRDHRRSIPNVWTTTNRVYATNEPDRLLMALSCLAQGDAIDTVGTTRDSYTDAAERIVSEELAALRHFGIQ